MLLAASMSSALLRTSLCAGPNGERRCLAATLAEPLPNMDAVLPVAADSTTVLTAVLLLTFQSPASDLPNRLHVHLCVLVWITQREGIPAACPSSMASSAEPTEADVAARSWAFDGAKSAAHAIVLNCLTLPRPRQSPLHAH